MMPSMDIGLYTYLIDTFRFELDYEYDYLAFNS